MSGPYTIKWGIFGGPSWRESREEATLEDALYVAQSNGGTIFDEDGNQLTVEDIAAALHPPAPTKLLAEKIVNKLMAGTGGLLAVRLELRDGVDRYIGAWTRDSAIVAVERCLEGSGL